MAQKALFISVNDLKKNSVIQGGVDADKILPFVEVAQDIEIHRFLGTDLYNKLQADIIADTLTGDYLDLVNNHIKPMLIWYAQARYYPFAAINITNGGAVKAKPENHEAADKEEIDRLVRIANNNADWYTQRFIDYICNNTDLFPEYQSNTEDDYRPDKANDSCGWVL